MAEQGALDEGFLYGLNQNISVVLHDTRLVDMLSKTSPLGKDWKELAGLLNYTAEQVQKFEHNPSTSTSSCRAFLQHWQTKPGSTVRAFRAHLKQLGRLDIVEALDSVRRSKCYTVSKRKQTHKYDATYKLAYL